MDTKLDTHNSFRFYYNIPFWLLIDKECDRILENIKNEDDVFDKLFKHTFPIDFYGLMSKEIIDGIESIFAKENTKLLIFKSFIYNKPFDVLVILVKRKSESKIHCFLYFTSAEYQYDLSYAEDSECQLSRDVIDYNLGEMYYNWISRL